MQFVRCEQCNKPFPKDDMFRALDPYLSEVHPEDGPYGLEWWCDVCYTDRKLQI